MNPADPYTGSSLDLEFFGPFGQLSLFKVVSKQYLYLKLSPNTKLKKRNQEKEMATHSSVLAWRIPRTGEPGGLPSLGSHRVRHD